MLRHALAAPIQRTRKQPCLMTLLRNVAIATAAIMISTGQPAYSADLTQVIEKVRPSVVGVATFQKTRNPSISFRGTGFAVGDGSFVLTNAHVVPTILDAASKESLVVLVGRGQDAQMREAEKVAQDLTHDLALLKIKGDPLKALSIGDSAQVREGQEYAFTGFPIGTVLGLYPVTHRGMISALTPVAIPTHNSGQLDEKAIARLRSPFEVFQLDATAYPGNSGSPLYRTDTGAVIGIVNMVFVKSTKEHALAEPSGISYAIPSRYLRDLLREKGVAN
jgi:serine protease Do